MLEGVRILDLTTLLPGPYCTWVLASLGADVVKVEPPGSGDPVRQMPPEAHGASAAFLALNRGKRSLTLNLKHPGAVELFLALAPRFDVVVEQFRPGVVDRLGVGYAAVRRVAPQLVYCSISSYGQDGPYRDRPAHDLNTVAAAGILAATGPKGGPPSIPSVQVADLGGAALPAAISILAALVEARRSGTGRHLDVSMLDGALAWTTMQVANLFAGGEVPAPSGMTLNGAAPCYGVYRTKDRRWYSLGALEPKFWRAFCAGVGRDDLLPGQFSTGPEGERVRAELRAVFAARTAAEWDAFFAEHDVPAELVRDLAESFDHPQVRARRLLETHSLGDGWRLPLLQAPIPGGRTGDRPAPALGEHTDALLRDELGLSADRIAALHREGAL